MQPTIRLLIIFDLAFLKRVTLAIRSGFVNHISFIYMDTPSYRGIRRTLHILLYRLITIKRLGQQVVTTGGFHTNTTPMEKQRQLPGNFSHQLAI